jgi:5-methylthioadenosine/S-adenosylhomocysteine deaminase
MTDPGEEAVYTAALVYTDRGFERGRYVHVRDGMITGVDGDPGEGTPVDFADAALIPGAVNTHTHSHLALLRGSVNELDLAGWLKVVYDRVPGFGPEEAYLSAAMNFAESLLTGTTTTADFFYLNGPGNERVLRVIDAARDVGIRLVMGRTFMDAEWGGDATRETAEVATARYRELVEAYGNDPMVHLAPAPHSPYGASRGLIEAAAELASEYDTPWYMHLAESEQSAAGLEGVRAVQLLDEWGVLDERLVAVHAIWLQDAEVELLGERSISMSYNPASNLFFGERIVDWRRYTAAGIDVSLGTDSSASNNAQNLWADLRVAALSQRLLGRNPAQVSNREMVSLATVAGGRATRLPVGALSTGAFADFAVLDLTDLSLQPHDNLEAHLVYSMSPTAIRHVFVGGRQVVRDRAVVGLDAGDIARRINETGRWS